MSTYFRVETGSSQKHSQRPWQRTCRCLCRCNFRRALKRTEYSLEVKQTDPLKWLKCATTHLKCIRHQKAENLRSKSLISSSEKTLKKATKRHLLQATQGNRSFLQFNRSQWIRLRTNKSLNLRCSSRMKWTQICNWITTTMRHPSVSSILTKTHQNFISSTLKEDKTWLLDPKFSKDRRLPRTSRHRKCMVIIFTSSRILSNSTLIRSSTGSTRASRMTLWTVVSQSTTTASMPVKYQLTSISTIRRSLITSWPRTRCRKTTMTFSCATIEMKSTEWAVTDIIVINNLAKWDLAPSNSQAHLASLSEANEWSSSLLTNRNSLEFPCRTNSPRWWANREWITTLKANSFSNHKYKILLTTIWITCKNLDNSSKTTFQKCNQ